MGSLQTLETVLRKYFDCFGLIIGPKGYCLALGLDLGRHCLGLGLVPRDQDSLKHLTTDQLGFRPRRCKYALRRL